MSTKTMEELCVSRRFSFAFGCGLSACAGNLLKLFFSLLQKLTDAGNLPCRLMDGNYGSTVHLLVNFEES